MKPIILTALIHLLISTAAMAGPRWTSENIWLEAGWQVMNVIDWGHTRYVAESPDYQEWHNNPAIRPEPTRRHVDAYFITAAAFHWMVSYGVKPASRLRWQWISLGIKGAGVFRNHSIGVKLKF